jgi:hypothetical protein
MTTMPELLTSTDPFIRALAARAQQCKLDLAEGKITQTEFDDLAKQLVDMRAVSAAADDADRSNALREALSFLADFLGVAISL